MSSWGEQPTTTWWVGAGADEFTFDFTGTATTTSGRVVDFGTDETTDILHINLDWTTTGTTAVDLASVTGDITVLNFDQSDVLNFSNIDYASSMTVAAFESLLSTELTTFTVQDAGAGQDVTITMNDGSSTLVIVLDNIGLGPGASEINSLVALESAGYDVQITTTPPAMS